ncbi:MAG: maleylpyruvate isomerase N-terminal domain-containing protein, partial [Acidimicrobiia bacterium]|nr:maleylpyruvate isomerase N-terminal domain-containing protein [Acidimicrobiia bacterium]
MTYRAVITVDSLSRALTEAGNDFASMLRRVRDPDRAAIGSWTVGETAAHVARSAGYFLEVARGETTPIALDDVADHNDEFLAGNPERDPHVLADRFENDELALLTYAGSLDSDASVELFDRVVVPVSTLLAVELGEVLVHGYDIAGASGLDWPIASDQAALAVGGLLP